MIVLIVEDDAAVRRSLRVLVERAGHTALATGSGHDALEILLEATRIHLALIDWQLNGITGIEVAKKLKEAHPTAVSILISGHTVEDMRAQWLDPIEGFVAFLGKPLDYGILERYIQLASDSTAAAQ